MCFRDTMFFHKLKVCGNPALSRWWLAFSSKSIFQLRYVHCFFRHVITHLIDYRIMSVWLLYALGNQNFHVTHFIVIFVLLRWSGNKPVVSQKYAYEHTPALRCYRSYAGHGYKVQWAFTRDGIRLHLVLTDWTSLGEAELWILKQEYNLPHEYGSVTLKKKAGRHETCKMS